MTIKGKGSWQGKHWMQLPENREKVMRNIRKLQLGAKRARKNGTFKYRKPVRHTVLREVAHDIVRHAKRSNPVINQKKERNETTLIINGWRVTLGKGQIRIDNE